MALCGFPRVLIRCLITTVLTAPQSITDGQLFKWLHAHCGRLPLGLYFFIHSNESQKQRGLEKI